MKKSRNVTLAIVGSALLASGCGSKPARTLYDKAGQPVPRAQWKKADGTPNELYDDKGNLVPQDEVNSLYSSSSGSSSSYRSSSHSGFFWGGSGWGSGSSRGYSGGSGSSGSGGTASRGGFGSTGGSHASGGSSSS